MRLIFHVVLYILSILCKKKYNVFDGKICKKVDKNALDFEIVDEDDKITIKMKIRDCFPLDVTWYSGNEYLGFASHYIDDILCNSWFEQFKTVENKRDYINNHLHGLENNNNVKFGVHKKIFENSKDPIKCQIDIIKIENYNNIMNEFCNDVNSTDTSNSFAQYDVAKKMREKLDLHMSSYVITFKNITNGILNLTDYEISVYTSKKNTKDSSPIQNYIIKAIFDVLTHACITVAFFGLLIFAVRYSLSKYF